MRVDRFLSCLLLAVGLLTLMAPARAMPHAVPRQLEPELIQDFASGDNLAGALHYLQLKLEHEVLIRLIPPPGTAPKTHQSVDGPPAKPPLMPLPALSF